MRVLGVDAGGSATRAVLMSEGPGGETVELGELEGMNALLTPGAPSILASLVMSVGAELVGVGMPGMRTESAARSLEAALGEATGARVVVATDVEAALWGAFAGGPGIVVVAGTGSVAMGRDASGATARAGGHGYLLGDEGSAYWIGRQAAGEVLARLDEGVSPASVTLAGVLRDASGMDMDALVEQVHRHPADRSLLAGLAPAVATCADGGDHAAVAVMREAADQLVHLVARVERRLGSGAAGPVPAGHRAAGPLPVCALGGVFRSEAVRSRFGASRTMSKPAHGAATGAALMAVARSGAALR
ncbi:MAG: N-acetylglucosamine kinase [Acidimicrobiales bacterium]